MGKGSSCSRAFRYRNGGTISLLLPIWALEHTLDTLSVRMGEGTCWGT